MTRDPWRLCCGRCGSRQVRRTKKGTWFCEGGKHATPAVYDLKANLWRHVSQNDTGGPVPKSDGTRGTNVWVGGGTARPGER